MWQIYSSSYDKECFKPTGVIAENGTKVRVCVKTFDIYFSKDGSKILHHFRIKPGFTSDGASIPTKILQRILNKPWDENLINAYLIHDILYSCKFLPRKEADIILKDVLRAFGVNFIETNMIYLGVHLFGQKPWERSQNQRSFVEHRRINLY